MENKNYAITIIMPALDEEHNIAGAISDVLKALDDLNINGEVVVINDGSRDSTERIVNGMMEKCDRVRMLKHDTPKGIGASFWDGVDDAKSDVVVLLPGDNENDPSEVLRYLALMKDVDLVVPFIFNKEARSGIRNALSDVFRLIINMTFFVNFNYTNGTIMYRKSVLKELGCRVTDFFFQVDILIRTVKKGYLFAEVPCRLKARKGGSSKAVSFRSLNRVCKGYLKLVVDYYFKRDRKAKPVFAADSVTLRRRSGG